MQNTARAARKEGQHVEVNKTADYINIHCGEDNDYMFQGHEIDSLKLDMCPSNVSVEDWLLWQAQSW